MRELTKAEEEVMQILWDLDKGFVKEIRAAMPAPKPAYNTVSTIIRILEKKGFVWHNVFGNTHQYYPLVSRKEYSKKKLASMVNQYFRDSYSELVSFFAKNKEISVREMEEIIEIMNQELKNKQND
jgi:BlaI family transcriptional regulator, penicillinase repressor